MGIKFDSELELKDAFDIKAFELRRKLCDITDVHNYPVWIFKLVACTEEQLLMVQATESESHSADDSESA
jgi:hypothetical protein